MAKVRDNPITEGLSGKLGRRLFFRKLRNGTTLLCRVPDFSHRVFSPGQLTHQSRFQQAAAYARVAAKTIPLYAELAQQRLQPAYNIALSDWFHAPVIHQVQQNNGSIHVEASDNVMVAKVVVTVLDAQGTVLEQAEAIRGEGNWWEYVPKMTGSTITAEAHDLAGNVTKSVL